jgi:hypothetical protein
VIARRFEQSIAGLERTSGHIVFSGFEAIGEERHELIFHEAGALRDWPNLMCAVWDPQQGDRLA